MKEIHSYEEWQNIIEGTDQFLLFVKTDHCSVCDGLYPQVAALQEEYPFPFYKVNTSDTPEIAGQLSLFTAPVVLLFHQQKEMSRFARIVQMQELKKRMDELAALGEVENG